MKLTIEHLAPYLPYGLKVIVEYYGIETMIGLNKGCIITDVDDCDFIGIKPILRNLSDLTKKIEVNGEKFVPINHLLDIHSKCNWSASDYLVISNGVGEWWTSIKGGYSIFGYNEKNGFYQVTQNGVFNIVKNQIKLYQKLFSWHFDVFNLIENGLAIDINTIKI